MSTKSIQQSLYFWALLFLCACSDPTRIGLNLSNEGTPNINFVDTVKVETSVILLDSISNSGSGRVFLGSYRDPDFGLIEAEPFFQIVPASSSIRFKDNAVFEKMEIILPFITFYGDTGNTASFSVHELTDTMGSKRVYQYFDNEPHNPIPLTTVSYKQSFADSTYIRFRLDDLGRRILADGNALVTEVDEFLKKYPGIKLVNQGEIGKAITYLNIFEGASAVIYYKTEPNGPTETYEMQINFNSAHSSHIKNDRTGTPLEALKKTGDEIPTSLLGNKCYIHSMLGIRTLMKFPNLENIRKSVGSNVNVVKANLNMKPIENGLYNSPEDILYFVTGPNKRNVKGIDGYDETVLNENFKLFGGFTFLFSYNYTDKNYQHEMTSYIRDLTNGRKSNNGIIMSVYSAGLYMSRSVFYDANASAELNPLKLKYYYLQPN